MQRIERYGVIALVFLLVTIMAVALWGQREEQGLLSFMKKGKLEADEVELPNSKVGVPITAERRASSRLPINSSPHESVAAAGRDARVRDAWGDSKATTYVPPSPARGTPPSAAQGRPSTQITPTVAQKPGRSDTQTPARTEPRTQPAKRGQVAVRRGETLSHIAQRELGSAQRWREILDLNPGLDPRRMHEGTLVKLPAGDTIARSQAAPVVAPAAPVGRVNGSGSTHSKRYTVQRGDTLSQIALDELGRASRWKEIVELNPGLDPERVLAGTRIVLPTAARPTPALAKAEPAPARPREIARATTTGRRVR